MTDFLDSWVSESEENAKLVAQETLITEVTEKLWRRMEECGVSKSELAKKLGASKGFVSQVLSGSRNMTLRTLADICFRLECTPTIRLEARPGAQEWHSAPESAFALKAAKSGYVCTGNVISPADKWQKAA